MGIVGTVSKIYFALYSICIKACITVPTVRVRRLLESKVPVPELYIIQPKLSEYDELIAVA